MKPLVFGLKVLAAFSFVLSSGCASSGGSPEFADIKFICNREPDEWSYLAPVFVRLDSHAVATFEPIAPLKDAFVRQWDFANADEIVFAGDYHDTNSKYDTTYLYLKNGKLVRAFDQPQPPSRTWEDMVQYSWIKILPEQRVFLCSDPWGPKPCFAKINLDTGGCEIVPMPALENGVMDTKPLRKDNSSDLIFLVRNQFHDPPSADEKTTSRIMFLDPVSLTAKRTLTTGGVEIVRLLSFGNDENTVLAYGKLAGPDGHVLDDSRSPEFDQWAFISVNLTSGEFSKIMDDTLPGLYHSDLEMAIFGKRYVLMNRRKKMPPPTVGGYYGNKSYLVDLQKIGWEEITYPYHLGLSFMQNFYPSGVEGDTVGWIHPVSMDSLTFGP